MLYKSYVESLLKLPSLESRSDVNVWSTPSRFFERKEKQKNKHH